MTAIKASDVDRFIAKPDPAQPIVLVFGPDAGLVRERVDALVRAAVDDPNDPFAFVRIEGEELSANPSRLVEEAHTIPLFGARRAVERLPRHHRGRRLETERAAARAVRKSESRRRAALLRGRRARPGAAD